jgi:hypothetical protein
LESPTPRSLSALGGNLNSFNLGGSSAASTNQYSLIYPPVAQSPTGDPNVAVTSFYFQDRVCIRAFIFVTFVNGFSCFCYSDSAFLWSARLYFSSVALYCQVYLHYTFINITINFYYLLVTDSIFVCIHLHTTEFYSQRFLFWQPHVIIFSHNVMENKCENIAENSRGKKNGSLPQNVD